MATSSCSPRARVALRDAALRSTYVVQCECRFDGYFRNHDKTINVVWPVQKRICHLRCSVRQLLLIAMRTFIVGLLFSSLMASTPACHSDDDGEADHRPPRQLIEQIAPPLDLKTPPADVTKTASGLAFTK